MHVKLSMILDEIEESEYWGELENKINSAFMSTCVNSNINREELIECMFYSAWDLYFQQLNLNVN